MSIKFRDIEEFLEHLPEEELKIVKVLRNLIRECIPGCTEMLSYNVPFYKGHKQICFIWPASVLWGNKQTYEGVRLGFNQGYLMKDEINFLNKGERKQVYWREFRSVKEMDIDILKTYLFEAAEIDNKNVKNKKRP